MPRAPPPLQGNQYSRAKQQMTELIQRLDAASLR